MKCQKLVSPSMMPVPASVPPLMPPLLPAPTSASPPLALLVLALTDRHAWTPLV